MMTRTERLEVTLVGLVIVVGLPAMIFASRLIAG
jgi:hypothetical protein